MTYPTQRSRQPSRRSREGAGRTFLRILQTWALIALGVLFASVTSAGIEYADNRTLAVVVVVLSLFNVLLRPVLILFALPFVILTFGLGILIINALIIHLTAHLVDGFNVTSFWASLWAAVVISIVSFLANVLFARRHVRVSVARAHESPRNIRKRRDDDIIDV